MCSANQPSLLAMTEPIRNAKHFFLQNTNWRDNEGLLKDSSLAVHTRAENCLHIRCQMRWFRLSPGTGRSSYALGCTANYWWQGDQKGAKAGQPNADIWQSLDLLEIRGLVRPSGSWFALTQQLNQFFKKKNFMHRVEYDVTEIDRSATYRRASRSIQCQFWKAETQPAPCWRVSHTWSDLRGRLA